MVKIRVTYFASIDDQELIDNDIDLSDHEAIEDYFYENGSNLRLDYDETFEVLE